VSYDVYRRWECLPGIVQLLYVNFARDRLSIISYSDDAIPAKVDTWADTVTALA
jgi:hypothetical protein